jgi:hypothetical protein
MDSLPDPLRVRQRLRWVRWAALLDLVLLVALLTASFTGNRPLVSVLGPLHGGNFLLLLTLTATAAADGLWSWWFPAGVLVTGGPLGALVGERLIARRLARQEVIDKRQEISTTPITSTLQNSEPSP